METKQTIECLYDVIDELKENDEFKNKDFFELFNLAIKIMDLSLKDCINLNVNILEDINFSLHNVCNNLEEINKTLICNQ